MDGTTHRQRRRGFHPAGALVASVLGLALGLGVTFLPSAAGASAPLHPTTSAPAPTTTTVPPATATTTAKRPAPPKTTVAARPAVKQTTTTTARPPAATATTAPSASASHAAALAAASTHYAFLSQDQGRPVRYDPCTPIHYTVNLAEAPANAMTDLQEAVRRISAATGLSFVYDGESTEIPTSHRELHGANVLASGWPPVIVAWAKPGESDLLTNGSVGEGGSTWSGFPGHEVYVTGLVVIDSTQNDRLASGFGGRSLGAVLMHELGHLVGLDHVNDTTQMMYPTVTGKPAQYGAGDLAGLKLLGAEQGCFSG